MDIFSVNFYVNIRYYHWAVSLHGGFTAYTVYKSKHWLLTGSIWICQCKNKIKWDKK